MGCTPARSDTAMGEAEGRAETGVKAGWRLTVAGVAAGVPFTLHTHRTACMFWMTNANIMCTSA